MLPSILRKRLRFHGVLRMVDVMTGRSGIWWRVKGSSASLVQSVPNRISGNRTVGLRFCPTLDVQGFGRIKPARASFLGKIGPWAVCRGSIFPPGGRARVRFPRGWELPDFFSSNESRRPELCRACTARSADALVLYRAARHRRLDGRVFCLYSDHLARPGSGDSQEAWCRAAPRARGTSTLNRTCRARMERGKPPFTGSLPA